MDKKYRRLSLKERVVIETLLKEKRSKSYIAQELGRSRSTISREINKWIKGKGDTYDADLAQWCAQDDYLNKRNTDKINKYPKLKTFVYKGLKSSFSPEQISGRLKVAYPNDPVMSISYEAIYQHIYKHRQSRVAKELIKFLPRHHSRRRNSNKGLYRDKLSIKNKKSIELRPDEINQRIQFGHWEGDLIIGKGQKSAVLTLVERKTRYVIIKKVSSKKSEEVVSKIVESLKKMPKNTRLSMTYDNGSEMAKHGYITQQLGLDVYFAHPYSSWERGTNENTNGLIRRVFPKKTDFRDVTQKELNKVQVMLNNRPRKVLKYRTPSEAFFTELKHNDDDDRVLSSEITFSVA